MNDSAAPRRSPRRTLFILISLCIAILSAATLGLFLCRPLLSRKPTLPPPPMGRFVTVTQYESSLTFQTQEGLIVTVAGISLDGLDPAARTRAAARLRELAPAEAVVFIEKDIGSLPPGGSVRVSVYIVPPGAAHTLPFPYQQSHLAAGLLVQEGLARVDESQHYIYQNELLISEYEAQRHERGIWAPK
jgi:hypothetical protein